MKLTQGIDLVFIDLSKLEIQEISNILREIEYPKTITDVYLDAEEYSYLYKFNGQWNISRIKKQVTSVLNKTETSYTSFMELLAKSKARKNTIK